MNLRRINMLDLPSIDAPDVGGFADDLLDLASAAADAVSSAAGNVPGLEDVRAVARRRRLLSVLGVVAVLVLVAAIVRRRQRDDPST